MFPVNDDKREQRAKFEFWRCWNAIYHMGYPLYLKPNIKSEDSGVTGLKFENRFFFVLLFHYVYKYNTQYNLQYNTSTHIVYSSTTVAYPTYNTIRYLHVHYYWILLLLHTYYFNY